MPFTTLEETTSHKRLRVFSAVAAVIAVLQALLGVTNSALRNDILGYLHEGFGYLYVAAAVLTVFPAVVWGRLGRRPSLIGHAAGMAVIALVQLLLGLFAPKGPLVMLHMGVGLLIVLGAIALYLMARKMPVVVTSADRTPRA